MALRIIEAHVPAELAEEAREAMREFTHESWIQPGGRNGAIVRVVLGADRTGAALDRLHEGFAARGALFVLVQPLEGVLPRPHASPEPSQRADARSAAAVSREEVYANIAGNAKLDHSYLTLVVLATLVAGIGLARDNSAAVIGAMVVAPLLGPNMALALGMVLGDLPLAPAPSRRTPSASRWRWFPRPCSGWRSTPTPRLPSWPPALAWACGTWCWRWPRAAPAPSRTRPAPLPISPG